MNHLLNSMRQQAAGVVGMIDHPRIGTIQNYDPATYTCKVLLQPEGALTGWLPIQAPWVGNGWGMFCPPGPGVAVAVIPKEGSYDAAFILPGFFNDEEKPLAVAQGEFWLVHQSGASVKLTNNGEVTITAPTINLNGNVLCSRGDTGAFMDQQGNLVTVIGGIIAGGVS